MELVEKSVLVKVSETPSLKFAPGADVTPEVDVDVVLGVAAHAGRTIAMATPSAPSARRRLAKFDFMVFSSRVSDSDSRTLYFSGAFRNPVFPAEWSSQLHVNSNKNGIEREQFTQMKLLLKPTPSFLLVCLTSSDKNNILYTKFRIHYTRAKVKSSRKIARGVALVIY